MALLELVQARLQGEPGADQTARLQALCDLASVRICLRVKELSLPPLLEPIAADACVKLFRRWNYEGIASEGADTTSTSFVEDVLAEYDAEFAAYLDTRAETSGAKVVRFL